MQRWEDYLNICEQIDPASKDIFRERPKISVVGCFQNGKSTFINCLLDEFVARPGDGRATTKISTRYRWGENTSVNFRTNKGVQPLSLIEYLKCGDLSHISHVSAFQAEITLNKEILKKIELIDTPGFEANDQDTENATRSLDEANYAIVILANNRTLGSPELAMFESLESKKIPYAVIMNCRDINIKMQWYPTHKNNKEIIKENEAIFQRCGYTPDRIDNESLIYPCNFLWYWFTKDAYKSSADFLKSHEYLSEEIEFALRSKRLSPSTDNLVKSSKFLPIKIFFEERLAHI